MGTGVPKPYTASGIESGALSWHVSKLASEHLEELGLDPGAVTFISETVDCPRAIELD